MVANLPKRARECFISNQLSASSMQSLALISSTNEGYAAGPAKSDANALPLGAVWVKPSRGRSSNDAAFARPAAAAPCAAVDGCPSTLPPAPPGPPVMVLFPATLNLATFFAPPSALALASGVLSLVSLLGSWGWGWGLVSSAGVASGVGAGVAVGLGVRLRPLGGWGGVALVSAISLCWLYFGFGVVALLLLAVHWKAPGGGGRIAFFLFLQYIRATCMYTLSVPRYETGSSVRKRTQQRWSLVFFGDHFYCTLEL